MGGFFRRVFSPVPPPAPAPVRQVVTADKSAIRQKRPGEGTGVTGTIMTSSEGIEDEANVSKTVLGGETTKKKKYKT